MRHFLTKVFFGLRDRDRFIGGIEQAIASLKPDLGGMYAGDNLFTFDRNLSFLYDEKLMAAYKAHTSRPVEQAILWRTSVVCWAALQGMRLDGDLVECGALRGTTARIVADYVDLVQHPGRKYYIYDLFEHDPALPYHMIKPGAGDLHFFVCDRFRDLPNARIIKGKIPASFEQEAPERVSFLHIDLNDRDSEIAALDALFPRLITGGVLILDDYGQTFHHKQKVAEDGWLAERGYRVLELPTGQGMVIKHN